MVHWESDLISFIFDILVRQYSRDLEENLRHSRDSSPDRETPRNKTKRVKISPKVEQEPRSLTRIVLS